ncbi:MAG: TIGR02206 family membrane protein [Leptolyngbya sp. PLA3]|nr:MAG: TIGR02206 family membrane protein [Cyanobacteria bacterium CYA]MCE7969791.1 TIGR02206 family membrane protein [Leptolyngbya sp. PL-A3]
MNATVAVNSPWAFEFRLFGPLHVVTVAALLGAMAAAIMLGRRWHGTRRERLLRHAWIGATLLWQTIAVIWYLWPTNFDLFESLPLHMCDLAAWIAPFALLTQKRLLRALLFFWGIGLSTQAFFTPVVDGGINTFAFWLFWVGHTQIVGSAVYDLGVLGYRPSWRDYFGVTLVNLACLALILPFDLWTGTNYWYVGNMRPEHPTLVDRLGPWPWRVVWMVLIAQAVLALLTSACAAAARSAQERPASIHSTQ